MYLPAKSYQSCISILLLIILLLFFNSCRENENKIDRYLKAANELWGFEGVALVAVDGKVILSRGYGMANQAVGEPNTPRTRFYIGSITKQFTAAAILRLQEDGLLDINDPISKYLPDYPRPAGDKITIHHLLSHSSGIPNYTDDPNITLRRTVMISQEELMASFENKPLLFEPGTNFNYSNSNYVILGKIIEVVSGQSYEAYLHNKILKPAGMLNTGYARREAGIPDRADGYTIEERGEIINALPVHFSILHSAGALYSTVGDMLLWDQALYSEKVLSRESIDLMLTRHVGDYGYGWVIEKRFGRTHTYHGGFLDGFNTTFDRWLEDRLCIVVFSNEDEAPVKKIAKGIAAIIFGKPYVMPAKKTAVRISPDMLTEYEGIYHIDEYIYRNVFAKNDTLFTNIKNQPPQMILPQAVDTFFFVSDNSRLLAFHRNEAGRIDSLALIDDGMAYPAIRETNQIKDGADDSSAVRPQTAIMLPMQILSAYVGEYRMTTIQDAGDAGFMIKVSEYGGKLYAQVGETPPIKLSARSETVFFHSVAEFELTFIIDDNGNATGCIIRMAEAEILAVKVR